MFTNTFNNREIAIFIWIIIGIAFLSFRKSLETLPKLLRATFSKKLIPIYLIVVLYTGIGIYILYKIKWWNISEIKDTIWWLLFAASIALFNINKVKENKNYFKKAVKDIFKLSVVSEFIINLHVFSLIVELLIVPLSVLIAVFLAVAQTDKKYLIIQKFLKAILFLLGSFIIVYSIYKIIVDFKLFATLDTLHDFILTPLLSIWFLPFLYLLSTYMKYEVFFVLIPNTISPKLVPYIKTQALLRFNIDTESLERWRMILFREEIKTKYDIIFSIQELKKLQKIEKNPPVVNPKLGWSPYEAKDFLIQKGIETRYYTHTFENEWYAGSSYVKLNNELLSNNVSYSVIGNKTIAKTLELVLDIKSVTDIKYAFQTFLLYSKCLYEAALKKKMPSQIESAILKSKNETIIEGDLIITVQKEEWLNQNNSYSLNFTITHQ